MTQEDPTIPKPRTEDYEWMPNADWLRRHERLAAEAARGEAEILVYGDSITEGLNDSASWRQRMLPRKALALGISGDRTAQLLWRLENGEAGGLDPKQVFLLIGTNNFGHFDQSAQEVAAGVAAVSDSLRRHFSKSTIYVFGIFPTGEKSSEPVRSKIILANQIISKLDNATNLKFLEIGGQFLAPDGRIPSEIMPDFLHLSEQGYKIWVRAMEAALKTTIT